jgi:hypothetical protein
VLSQFASRDRLLLSKVRRGRGGATDADAIDARLRPGSQMLRSAAWDSAAESGLHLARLMQLHDLQR